MNTTRKDTKNVFKNKMNAERLLLESIVFTDTKEYCDTVSVTEDLVHDGMCINLWIFHFQT